MLDFRRLRGGVDGQRGSFERLVCHLAEVSPPQGASEFRNIEGAGGDGGVEAYWVLSDGTERGWQAKFHDNAGDIDWAALSGSITTAMSTHPAMQHVTVTMACDLTDIRVQRGTSAREKWNKRLKDWTTAAGRPFNVEFVGSTQIERMLADPRAAGLREYWFGERNLSDAWFRERFDQTVASLDERYHPKDHVDVEASQLFLALRGSPDWRRGHRKSVEALATLLPGQPEEGSADADWHSDLSQAIRRLKELAAQKSRPERLFPLEEWTLACQAAADAIKRAGLVIYDEMRPDRQYNGL